MADRRTHARGIKPSSTNGDTLQTLAGVTTWAAPAGVLTVVPGTYIRVDATDPNHVIVTAMVPMSTLVDGKWELVFDTDGHLVYTDAP